MAARRTALRLIVALVIFVAGAVPASAQDLDFTAVPRVSFGLTNSGVTGALCSTGLLNFSKSGTPAVTTGALLSGTDVRCQDESTFPISGGSLTFFSANRSVTGTLGDEFVLGHALPGGHALIAADTFGPESVVPFGLGLTALVERHGTSFTQANLTGRWRIVGLIGQNGFAGGSAENYFGDITFFANRSATGTVTIAAPLTSSESIFSADVTVSANGSVTGVITTVVDGDVFTDITVNGLMTPDLTVVVGVTSSDRFEDFRHGMFFMQKDPGATPFTGADLAGSWHVVSLQAVPDNSAAGDWFAGGLTFSAVGGNASQITASNLASSSGETFPAVSDNVFFVSPNGFVSGGAAFADGINGLLAFGTLSADKKHLIGINVFGVGDETEVSPDTIGLFSMVRLAPPPPASTVQFSTGNYSVTEGNTAKITVTRSPATPVDVTVSVLAFDPFLDTTLASGTLTIPAGKPSATFDVPTIANFAVGDDHLVSLSLGNPTNGASLGARSTASLLVISDDSSFAFTQPTYVVSEAAKKAAIGITRSGGLGFPATVLFTASPGTAVAGTDFTPVSRNVSFAKNVATASVDVTILNNTVLDGNRSVILELFPPVVVGAPATASLSDVAHPTATLIIVDDDTPGTIRLSSASYSGDEGKEVTITIVRAAAPGKSLGGNVTVDYTTSSVNSSATAGVDYTVTSGTATFVGNQTTFPVKISLTKDNLAEGGPETFKFMLSNPSNNAALGDPSSATVTINDLDKGGIVSLSDKKYSVPEGNGSVTITIKRVGGNAANASVLFTAFSGSLDTATPGLDYGNVSTTVTFGLNEMTRTVVVPIIQDTLPEGDETFTVMLSNPSAGVTLGTSVATVTIVDDESAIKFTQAAFETKEGTPGKIVVTRSGALGTQAVVPYNISVISAFPGVDFTAPAGSVVSGNLVSGTLTFKPKDTQQFLMIPTINNTKLDGNRSVLITLGTPTGGAQLSNPSTATFTIIDDDQPGVFRLGSASYSVKEGGMVTVDIMRLPAPGVGGPLGGNVSVAYATSSGNASAGSDFIHTSGVAVFGPNETKFPVLIQTRQDTLADPTESFFFTLSSPTGGATLGSPSMATIFIQDDDQAGVVFLNATAYKVAEGAGNISVTVVRSGGSANASVDFATMPGTATDGFRGERPAGAAFPEGADYGAVFTTLNFGAGEMSKTVVIPIFQDDLGEGDEFFTVVLSNPQGGLKLGKPSSAPVTIVDDEVVIEFSGKFKNNQPEVVRRGPSGANVSVQYVATSGTAILGQDFILPPGTLVFPPGVTSRTIPIVTVNDNIAEGPETFTIVLLNPSPPAKLGPFFSQDFTLDDNDFGGTVGFGNTSVTAGPGETKAQNIVRSKDGLGTVMTVGWSAIGGTAVPDVDFSPSSGQVTFHEGDLVMPFAVTLGASPSLAGKTIVFGLTIPGAGAARLAASNVSTLTILGPPVPSYSFTVLYSGAESVGLPSLNDNGGFAFSVDEEMPTVFSGNLETPTDLRIVTALPDSGVQSLRGIRFPVDSGERVAFQANLEVGFGVVLDSNSSAPSVFFATGDGIDFVGEPSMSFNGTFAFKTVESCDGICNAVHFSTDGDTDNYAVISGDTTSIGFVNTIGDFPAVNDGGLVAFTATMYTGEKGVFTSNGSAITTLASAPGPLNFTDFGPSVSINNNGHVAFIGILADGNASVNFAYGDAVSVSTLGIASTSSGGFTSFGTGSDASPAISNAGHVAFVGFYTGGHGIFAGGDLVNDKVVATGDVIAGHTVAGLELGGINANGQISFLARFTDGRFAAVVATPPTPVGCGLQCQRPAGFRQR